MYLSSLKKQNNLLIERRDSSAFGWQFSKAVFKSESKIPLVGREERVFLQNMATIFFGQQILDLMASASQISLYFVTY